MFKHKVHRRDEVCFTCTKYGCDNVQDNAGYHRERRVGTVTEVLGEAFELVTTKYTFSMFRFQTGTQLR